MNTAAVELQGVRVAYGDGAPALDGVDLRVAAGGFTALVGGSGSGKTTLLKTINRLVAPTGGVVRIDGADARGLPGPELRRRIGYVFQEAGLFPHMTVAENIALPLRLAGRDPAERARRVDALLDMVSLPRPLRSRAPAALSGGQRQRVGVARALAAEPGVLLMDEPFGALDPATRETLGAGVRELHDRLGLTTLMVTHDMGEALLLADRVVVLDAGRVVADRTPAELLSTPAPHPAVEALLSPPRRQAERLRALESGVDSCLAAALSASWAELPGRLSAHVLLSASALGLAVALSLPLALLALARPRLRWGVLTAAGAVQTVPGLALVALFYPLLLAVGAFTAGAFGVRVPALGFLPSLLALTLYGMLPVLRNAVTGFAGLDPVLREAADAVGMTRRQKLLWVEAPLAAPVVMAGVRTAAVLVIGTAVLSTPVGQPSLGDYIFSGLQTEDWVAVLFGCAASAALALATDAALSLVEDGARRRDGRRLALGGGLIAAGVLAAAVAAALAAGGGAGGRDAYVVGAKNFGEQFVLSELMARRLRAAARVELRSGLGSAVVFRALAAGDLDAYVDYSGTLWTNVLGRRDTPPGPALLRALGPELRRRGVVLLGLLGFENAYALTMRAVDARRLGVRTLSDLAPRAPDLRLAADLEFLARPEWRALRAAYGLRFRESRAYTPTFMYRALADGSADVASAFSSDGRLAGGGLVALADDRRAAPAYDAVVLVSARRAGDARLLSALRPLLGRIDPARMRAANAAVDLGGRQAADVAADLDRALR